MTNETIQKPVEIQSVSTPYSVPLDYVMIAVVFFSLGVFVAYKLMKSSGNIIEHRGYHY